MSEETFAKIAGKDLANVVTTHQLGLPADKLDFYAGSFDAMESHFRKIAHKPVLNFLGTLFDSFGDGETKVAKHIKALAKFPIDHSEHTKCASHEIFDIITSYASTCENLERVKAAGIADYIPGVGGAISDTALTVGSLATALTGAGAGAAYWHANKETQEDDAELEAKREKVKYYRGLVEELKQRAKYS